MFRCTECNKEYEIKPDYCDCGNDEFVEVAQETEQFQQEMPSQPSSIFEQNSLKPQQVFKPEIEEEKFNFDTTFVKKKKITFTLIGLSIFVSLFLLLFVGNGTPKKVDDGSDKLKEQQKQELAEKIPDIDTFWDDTPPFKTSKGSSSSLPLLNDNIKNISGELKSYMVSIGNEFVKNWSTSLVKGDGTCIIEFTIDKNGLLDTKKIVAKSENESLNESVLMTLSKVSTVEAPPEQYKGERIRLTFFIDKNGKYKMYYP